MTATATRFGGRPWAGRPARPTAWPCRRSVVALLATLSLSAPVSAQIFGDRPPPIPPASVPLPDGVGSGAVSLAPPSGPAAVPALPPSILAPAMVAPVVPAAPPAAAAL